MTADDEKTREYLRFMRAMRDLGFPAELAEMLAEQLGGPWSLRRMTGYLRQARPTRLEDIADELVAILEERRSIVERQISQAANAGWTEFLNEWDADTEEDEGENAAPGA